MARLCTLKPQVATIPQAIRPQRTERIRGRALQAIRRAQIQADPLCARCKERGIVRLGVISDHKVALCNGGAELIANRQLLCHECNIEKTREDMAIARGEA